MSDERRERNRMLSVCSAFYTPLDTVSNADASEAGQERDPGRRASFPYAHREIMNRTLRTKHRVQTLHAVGSQGLFHSLVVMVVRYLTFAWPGSSDNSQYERAD